MSGLLGFLFFGVGLLGAAMFMSSLESGVSMLELLFFAVVGVIEAVLLVGWLLSVSLERIREALADDGADDGEE